jgi:serine protease Do
MKLAFGSVLVPRVEGGPRRLRKPNLIDMTPNSACHDREMNDTLQTPIAATLEHLTGRSRGQVSWITTDTAWAWLNSDGRLRITATDMAPSGSVPIARFSRTSKSFEIETADGSELWVNHKAVTITQLDHCDMIEFEETGPLSRFRIYDEVRHPNMTLSEILGDMLSYMKSSRRPFHRRISFAISEFGRRLLRETTMLFRFGVLIALVLLAVAVFLQYRSDQRLRAEIESSSIQVESIASALAETRQEAIRPSDLTALRDDLGAGLSDTTERIEALEVQSESSTRVISAAASSVAFLQGGYGLRHRETGRMLRQVVGDEGLPIITRSGQPLLSLDGTGPVAEVQFNGTGFILADTGILVTNRHVALPWERNPGIALESEELEPVMTRFVAYLPGRPKAVELVTLGVSDDADVAFLRTDPTLTAMRGLVVATNVPRSGEEIIVMGYPTGLLSLLAQSGQAFVDELQKSGETGFWAVAERLAAANLIAPLSSRGIVGQTTPAVIVYDAETTRGGSGGPVLNAAGEVVAINAAIMPEFGGSNFGVPASHILALLADIGADN